MALVESNNIKLGQKMPAFELTDPNETLYSLDSLMGKKGLLVIFTCNHCPYAIAIWSRLIRLAKHIKLLDVNTVAVNPNINPSYPDDSPENMLKKITEWQIPFPYLVDQNQQVAKAYQAECTPDLYFLNENSELIYHGRLDDNWQNELAVKSEELKLAIETYCESKELIINQKPSMGCSIKWL